MPHLRRGPDRHNDAVKLLCPSEIQKRADGALTAAFLVRSAGYVVADRAFPVLSLSVEHFPVTADPASEPAIAPTTIQTTIWAKVMVMCCLLTPDVPAFSHVLRM
jgi:hypothetical protein